MAENIIRQKGSSSSDVELTGLKANSGSLLLDNTEGLQAWVAGQVGYAPGEITVTLDSGIPGVRLQAGEEEWWLVCNNSAAPIANGKPCYASGVDAGTNCLEVDLADASDPLKSLQYLGLATHTIPNDGSPALVTYRGYVRDFDTSLLTFTGLQWLGVEALTSTKPLYPVERISSGVLIKQSATEGIVLVAVNRIPRQDASRSYSQNPGLAGVDYLAGFYDWKSTSVTLNESTPTTTYGEANSAKAAHIGIVSNGPGVVVGGGQVGIKAVGVKDSETGPQLAAQDMIISEDITTLTADTRFETSEKGSGEYSLELYVVSGTPTAYSLTCNTGYSKYEDNQNIPMTILGIEAQWKGTATDNGMNIELMHEKSDGWTFAASGFVPGDGIISERLVDQALVPGVRAGQTGAYKRTNLSTFISGDTDEGYVMRVTTTQNNCMKDVNISIPAVSEKL